MNKCHLLLCMVTFLLLAGCSSTPGNFQTQLYTDLATAVKHLESTLNNKEMKVTKSTKGNQTVIQASNTNLDIEINLTPSQNNKKVIAYYEARSKNILASNPYDSIRDIDKNVKLKIEEEEPKRTDGTVIPYIKYDVKKDKKEEPERTDGTVIPGIKYDVKDTECPVIIIIYPDITRGIRILEKSDKTTITGKVQDSSKLSEVMFNNEELALDVDGNFKKEVSLSRGVNSFKITAIDEYHNKAAKEFVIERNEEQITPAASNSEISNWYRRQYAFVIGIDRYKNPNIPVLQNAVNDAKSLAEMLKSINFTVYELYNEEAMKDNIMNQLINIQKTITKEDSFLIYFAGHGQGLVLATGKRTGYILPYDADVDLNSESVIEYENEALPLETMKKITEAMSSKHVALLLDSCFSGLVMKRSIPKMQALTMEHYVDFLNAKTINILTAGSDQPVSDGSGHSPFTMAILDGLQNKEADFSDHDGYVTLEELYVFVKDKVEKATDSRQQPQFDNMIGGNGNFIFKVR